jgi:hypothetical protein
MHCYNSLFIVGKVEANLSLCLTKYHTKKVPIA